MFKDGLGGFKIPEHLLKKAEEYSPPVVEDDAVYPYYADDYSEELPGDWTVVKSFNASKGNSIHRVERKGNDLRCTCQGFRIRKLGYCKHTEIVKKELGL